VEHTPRRRINLTPFGRTCQPDRRFHVWNQAVARDEDRCQCGERVRGEAARNG